jgi:hypothetical protein
MGRPVKKGKRSVARGRPDSALFGDTLTHVEMQMELIFTALKAVGAFGLVATVLLDRSADESGYLQFFLGMLAGGLVVDVTHDLEKGRWREWLKRK